MLRWSFDCMIYQWYIICKILTCTILYWQPSAITGSRTKPRPLTPDWHRISLFLETASFISQRWRAAIMACTTAWRHWRIRQTVTTTQDRFSLPVESVREYPYKCRELVSWTGTRPKAKYHYKCRQLVACMIVRPKWKKK